MHTETSVRAFAVRQDWRVLLLIGLTLPALLWVAALPPLPQALVYHDFADQRSLAGIPHFWNVVSNLPFGVIGLAGCIWLARHGRTAAGGLSEPGERRAYVTFFAGEMLTCFGSAWYHHNPNNATLIWDRLFLSLMLTSFFVIVVTEFVNAQAGRRLLIPMSVLGICSVWLWAWSESLGRGDLRPYLMVQFYPIVAIPLIMMLFRSRYTRTWTLAVVGLLYVAAKVAELYDVEIYNWIGGWSGHTVKHLVAAVASYLPLYGLQRRTVVSGVEA